jgi:hypothetical protein
VLYYVISYCLQGNVTDSMQVKFYTNATVYTPWPTGGLEGNGTGGVVNVVAVSTTRVQQRVHAS